MQPVNQHLIKTIGLSWLSFLMIGLGLRQVLSAPATTVLIDRSYCSTAGWQRLTQTYSELYHQHQQQILRIDQVVMFSDLGQETFSSPPAPATIGVSTTYGRPNLQRRDEMKTRYAQSHLLTCSD